MTRSNSVLTGYPQSLLSVTLCSLHGNYGVKLNVLNQLDDELWKNKERIEGFPFIACP